MSTFGRVLLPGQTGSDIMLSADNKPLWKPGGVTIDWGTVAAVSGADVLLNDGTKVLIGNKYLRYGQVVCQITNQPVQDVTVAGSPTGGTFTLTGTRPDNGNIVTTAPMAYNISAANMLAALRAVLGAGAVASVTLSSGDYTITFNTPIGILTGTNNMTGGTPTLTIVLTTAGANYGYYGPYDPTASDGRQALTRGACYLVNQTALQNLALGFGASMDDNPAVLEGGLVWKDRILQSGVATHTLALGPTLAEINTAFPALRYAGN